MSIRDEVIKPVVERFGGGLAAEELIWRTGLAESGYRVREQFGGGPALGYWQMEKATHDDIWMNYLQYRKTLVADITELTGFDFVTANSDALKTSDLYACVMCRSALPARAPSASGSRRRGTIPWRETWRHRLSTGNSGTTRLAGRARSSISWRLTAMGKILQFFSGGVLGKVVDGIAGIIKGKMAAKEQRATIQAKVQLAKVNKDSKLELADHELQVLRTQNAGGSWKDEYVTLLVSVPILVSMVGSLVSIVWPDVGARLITAGGDIATIMTGELIGYPELWMVVVTTSLGTKPFRS